MPSHFLWTAEREEQARTLWRSGVSSGHIARKLGGGVTRNAVIGKLHRLGETKRSKEAGKVAARINSPKREAFTQRVNELRPAGAPPAPPPKMRPGPLKCEPVPLGALTANSCRYPRGDVYEPAVLFCGAPKARGPYCEDCAAIAFKPLPNGQKPDAKAYVRAMRRYA
jgi:GcrA cell cycle regulator